MSLFGSGNFVANWEVCGKNVIIFVSHQMLVLNFYCLYVSEIKCK